VGSIPITRSTFYIKLTINIMQFLRALKNAVLLARRIFSIVSRLVPACVEGVETQASGRHKISFECEDLHKSPPRAAAAVGQLITDTFPEEYIHFMQGEREAAEALLHEKFDTIFFTGSTGVGRAVMTAGRFVAGRHLQ
jgi:hypothetical protein